MRVNGTEKVNMTSEIKEQIMDVVQRYGTGEWDHYVQWCHIPIYATLVKTSSHSMQQLGDRLGALCVH